MLNSTTREFSKKEMELLLKNKWNIKEVVEMTVDKQH